MNTATQRALAAALLSALAAPAAATQEVYLIARAFTQTMPDDRVVPMWGFAQDHDADFATTGDQTAASAPGPHIHSDGTELRIHLRNELPEPVSLMVPGQRATMSPVFFTDTEGRRRARSFTHETAPGETGTYTWPAPRPGTYAYRSATQPQVQVQMGLYGALTVEPAAGTAYPGVDYDQEALLFYSEVDPALHAAVADRSYGTDAYPSTIDYRPRYFLVNGAPFSDASLPLATAGRGGRTLLRLFNLGLRTRSLLLNDGALTLVAEDGNPYPQPRRQYSVMLAAGKTRDALFVPAAAGRYAVYDRMLGLTNDGQGPGGMLAFLEVADSGAPVAAADSYSVAEDSPLRVAAPGVLGNDTAGTGAELESTTSHGVLALAADGGFDYTPAPDFNGLDSFSYRALDGTLSSPAATVSIQVTPVNDAPVAAADSYQAVEGQSLAVAAPGVLANDTDVDGDPLSAVLVDNPFGDQLTLNADGSFTFTGTSGGSFSYRASDGTVSSQEAAIVTLTLGQPVNTAPTAVDDTIQTVTNESVTIDVLANDSDAEGNIDPASVRIATPPSRKGATATANADGTVTYTPARNFRGSDVFTYTVSDHSGATSNEASVRVDVVRLAK